MIKKVTIIGTGNVATYYAQKLYAARFGFDLSFIQIFGRSLSAAQSLAAEVDASPIDQLTNLDPKVDLMIIAVSDDAIEEVAAQLPPFFDGIVAHTSGRLDMSPLSKYHRRVAIIYPLQTFSKTVRLQNEGFPIIVDGNSESIIKLLIPFCTLISGYVFELSEAQKRELHLAAVFANNFTNHLIEIAERVCIEHEIEIDLLYPLLQETIHKATLSPLDNRQTGPAKRGDMNTIFSHLSMLENYPHWQKIYQSITESIQSSVGHKGSD